METTLTQMSSLPFHLKMFLPLGVCSLDVFFGQQFFHFPVDLYQLKQADIFGSILCDGLTSFLTILGMGATLPL